MSVENVKKYLAENGFGGEVIEFIADTATVALAAEAIGCEEKRIAKTLSFDLADGVALVVMSGESKVDNKRFKEEFLEKARMIAFEEVEAKTGHAPGGVCPFAVKEGVRVYGDVSLKRFDYFYPAAGSSHSAVKMTSEELEKFGKLVKWVDIGKGWREDEQ